MILDMAISIFAVLGRLPYETYRPIDCLESSRAYWPNKFFPLLFYRRAPE